jgi:hypothetical protein
MKTLLSFFLLIIVSCTLSVHAQQQYTVSGQTYTLKTEVEGPLTLLWNTIDSEYRYFAKKETTIVELKNTRGPKGYRKEYKEELMKLTRDAPIDTTKVKLTKASLKDFFIAYNTKVDPGYTYDSPSILLKARLGAFGGITNSIFTENPENALAPIAGLELEIIDEVKLKRHAVVLRFKQIFESSDYAYSASQFSMNYRFKFVKNERFDVFANIKFVAYTHSENDIVITEIPAGGETPVMRTESRSRGGLSAPGTFGVGADIALGKGYLTFFYDDIVGLTVDSNGEFPIDFSLGYKFSL